MNFNRKSHWLGAIALLGLVCAPLWMDDVADDVLECNEIKSLDEMLPALISALEFQADVQKNWEALYHYQNCIDGYYCINFARRCFLLFFVDKPLLLFEQYKRSHDPRLLKLLQDTACDYSPGLSGRKEESYSERKRSLDVFTQLIREQADSAEKRVFLEIMESYTPLYHHENRWPRLASAQILEQVRGGAWLDNQWVLLARLLQDELRVGQRTTDEWEALFLFFNTLKADELIRFYRDCFFLFYDEDSWILYRRYVETGDARVLALAKDLLEWHDPMLMNHEGLSAVYKEGLVVEMLAELKKLNAAQADALSAERGDAFITCLESAWEKEQTKDAIQAQVER